MATQMIVRIEPELKNKVDRLAKGEGKNLSELVRELLIKYTKERDGSSFIDELWERIADKLSEKGVSVDSVPEAINQVRSEHA